MATQLPTEKFSREPGRRIGLFDRIMITGSLAELCYAEGMTHYLCFHDILIVDCACFAAPLRDEIRANVESLTKAESLEIEYIRKKDFRKEDGIQAILAERGRRPGLVRICSAIDLYFYQPWHDKATGLAHLTAAEPCAFTFLAVMLSRRRGRR